MPRGGLRPGAGRKLNTPNKASAARQAAVAATGLTPLDIMLANARYFHEQALDAEAALAAMQPDVIEGLKPKEQFDRMLAEVKKAAGLRELAGEAARDAANYIHPRLTAIQGGDQNKPVKMVIEWEKDE